MVRSWEIFPYFFLINIFGLLGGCLSNVHKLDFISFLWAIMLHALAGGLIKKKDP